MKAAKISHLTLGLIIVVCLTFFPALTPQSVQAQDDANLEPAEKYNQEELAQMLAPIALYPDALLSQILMASTYPIEVIEADRWIRENQGLAGDRLDDALLNKDWDPSVKALCHFPSSLALMSERIAETTTLGNAFLAQESEVMEMIQKLREEAYAQGNLNTTSEQKVVVEKETIIIEPAYPGIIYVPYYDPYFVYGPWWWSPAYPPYYWGPAGVNIGASIAFWPGVYFRVSFLSWSYFDWHHHYIYIDVHKRPRFVRHDRWAVNPGRWAHVPSHRRGVAYRDKATARKYGQAPQRPTTFRRDTRGFPERNRIDQVQSRDAQTRTDRYHQEQQQVERKIKDLKKGPRDQPERQQSNIVTPKTDRGETGKMEKVPAGSHQQKQVPTVPKRQIRQQVERDRTNREEVARDKQKRVESRERQASPDEVFDRVEDGKQERQSGDRGRYSRKGLKDTDNRDQDHNVRKWR